MKGVITSVTIKKPKSVMESLKTGIFKAEIKVRYDNEGDFQTLFSYYHDEVQFDELSLIGKTEEEARTLFFKKDKAYLQ